jgi:hypothetical protein
MTVSCEYNKKKNGNFFVVVDFLHHVNALDKPWALPELGLWRLHLAQVLIQVMMPASGGYPTHTEHHWRCSNNNALANYL